MALLSVFVVALLCAVDARGDLNCNSLRVRIGSRVVVAVAVVVVVGLLVRFVVCFVFWFVLVLLFSCGFIDHALRRLQLRLSPGPDRFESGRCCCCGCCGWVVVCFIFVYCFECVLVALLITPTAI